MSGEGSCQSCRTIDTFEKSQQLVFDGAWLYEREMGFVNVNSTDRSSLWETYKGDIKHLAVRNKRLGKNRYILRFDPDDKELRGKIAEQIKDQCQKQGDEFLDIKKIDFVEDKYDLQNIPQSVLANTSKQDYGYVALNLEDVTQVDVRAHKFLESVADFVGSLFTHTTYDDEFYTKHSYTLNVSYRTKKTRFKDRFTRSINHKQIQAKKGACTPIKVWCQSDTQNLTKNQMISFEGKELTFPITRSCWVTHVQYQCRDITSDTCKSMNLDGCFFVKEQKKGQMVQLQYECKDKLISKAKTIVGKGGTTDELLDHTDFIELEQQHKSNPAEALARLSIIEEGARNPTMAGREIVNLMAGRIMTAFKSFTGIKNCNHDELLGDYCIDMERLLQVAKQKGLAVYLGLREIPGGSRDAALQSVGETMLIEAGLEAGSDVATAGTGRGARIIGKVIIKMVVPDYQYCYCVFNSKLAKAVNQAAREQGIKSWWKDGKVDCSGLSLDEMRKLDFGKVDMSEVEDDMRRKLHKSGFGNIDLKDRLVANFKSFKQNAQNSIVAEKRRLT